MRRLAAVCSCLPAVGIIPPVHSHPAGSQVQPVKILVAGSVDNSEEYTSSQGDLSP